MTFHANQSFFEKRKMGHIMNLLDRKVGVATPVEMTDAIRAFSVDLVGDSSGLVFVKIHPMPGCGVNRCHLNVADKVAKHGGEIVYGWSIWKARSGQWLEADFHSVWKKDGELIDITPDPDGEEQRLFLPDPSRSFTGNAVPKRHWLLTDNADIVQGLWLMSQANEIQSSYKAGVPLPHSAAMKVQELTMKATMLLTGMGSIASLIQIKTEKPKSDRVLKAIAQQKKHRERQQKKLRKLKAEQQKRNR